MKKLLVMIGIVIVGLFLIDRTIMKDKGIFNRQEQIEKYEKIAKVEALSVGLESGNLAPQIDLLDLEGNQVKLSDYKGKKVLLNFWASWCAPCEIEMPYMEKMYQKYNDDGLEILAVNMTRSEKNSEDAMKFVEEHDLTFPIPMDVEGAVGHDYSVLAYPTSYFIDSDGVIRSKVIGTLTEEYLETELLKLP